MKPSSFDLLVMFTQPPLAAATNKEALDVALVSATFDQTTALVFVGEGVLQLVKDQQPDELGLKGIQAMLKALPLYDLDQVFVQQEALDRFGLTAENLLLPVAVLNSSNLQQLMACSRNLLSF